MINIDLKANWVLNTVNLNHSEFTRFKKRILDSSNEYQQKTMTMRVLLVNIKHKDEDLQDQLKYKNVEVEKLKPKLISQKEEQDESAKELEETREANHDLNTWMEESNRI